MTKSPSGGKPREFWIVLRRATGKIDEGADCPYSLVADNQECVHVREVTEQDKAEGEATKHLWYTPDGSWTRCRICGGTPTSQDERYETNVLCPGSASPTPASPGEVRVKITMIKEMKRTLSSYFLNHDKDRIYDALHMMDEIEKSGRRE